MSKDLVIGKRTLENVQIEVGRIQHLCEVLEDCTDNKQVMALADAVREKARNIESLLG